MVTEADATVARCSAVTCVAEQAILDAKQIIAEGMALLALGACRAATEAYHVATIAAQNNFGDRLMLYPQEDRAAAQQQQSDRLRALARVAE